MDIAAEDRRAVFCTPAKVLKAAVVALHHGFSEADLRARAPIHFRVSTGSRGDKALGTGGTDWICARVNFAGTRGQQIIAGRGIFFTQDAPSPMPGDVDRVGEAMLLIQSHIKMDAASGHG